LRAVAGVPMLERALRQLATSPHVGLIVVAAPADQVDSLSARLTEAEPSIDVAVVAGGSSRQQSVAAALAHVPDTYDYVLVHDAARPFVPVDVIDRVVAALESGAQAVIPVLPVADTIKSVDAGGRVTGTPNRSQLRAVQTPQGFPREVLLRIHAAATDDTTDDAGLAEAAGLAVETVLGDPMAFKITHPFDLWVAESLAAADEGQATHD